MDVVLSNRLCFICYFFYSFLIVHHVRLESDLVPVSASWQVRAAYVPGDCCSLNAYKSVGAIDAGEFVMANGGRIITHYVLCCILYNITR